VACLDQIHLKGKHHLKQKKYDTWRLATTCYALTAVAGVRVPGVSVPREVVGVFVPMDASSCRGDFDEDAKRAGATTRTGGPGLTPCGDLTVELSDSPAETGLIGLPVCASYCTPLIMVAVLEYCCCSLRRLAFSAFAISYKDPFTR
jgi:hypothetical protein